MSNMDQVKKDYEAYIEGSGVKDSIADIIKDVEVLAEKVAALKEKVIATNKHDFVKRYIEAGYASYSPHLTNLRVEALAEYAQLKAKLKELKL